MVQVLRCPGGYKTCRCQVQLCDPLSTKHNLSALSAELTKTEQTSVLTFTYISSYYFQYVFYQCDDLHWEHRACNDRCISYNFYATLLLVYLFSYMSRILQRADVNIETNKERVSLRWRGSIHRIVPLSLSIVRQYRDHIVSPMTRASTYIYML